MYIYICIFIKILYIDTFIDIIYIKDVIDDINIRFFLFFRLISELCAFVHKHSS